MMLTIHGLPVNIKYHDVKMLIKKLCNIDDFILDNLVGDVDGFKKVRIGLANESEGAHLMKCLNGHRVGANVLSVMPVGKVIANAMDQRGGYPPRSDNMPNAPGNYGAQSLPLMGNRSGSWVNTGMPNNQWPQNAPAQSQLPQSSYGYQGPTQSFPQQQTGPLQRPEPRSFGQRDVFARPQEQGYGFGPKPNTPVHVQHRPDNRTHVLRSVEIIPSQMRGLTPANYPQQQNYEPNKPVTINKDFFQGSNQYAGGPSGQPGYAPQGSAQPSWNQSVQKPAPFAKHSPFDADRHYPPTDKRSALKDYDKGQSPHEQDSSRGRRVSPHARRVSPHGGRVSPHARRVSPHGGRVSPHARRVSPHASGGPPHEISDSKGRMPDRRNRESPGRRISPGRRTSPGDRRMPGQNSRKRSPTGRQIKSPPRHMRRHSDKDFATDRRPPVKQVRPAYEPEVKAPNQAMYAGGGYRPNSHENAPYPLSGSRQIEQRSSTWQQERDNPVFSGGMKKDDDRRDGRMPMGRGSEPILEKRPSPLHKPGSPSRREGRDRSPIRDRYRRHSPSPPSPRRSWALEKRRSPEMHDAPPPPIWPGQNTDDYSRPSRPEFPDRPEKFEKSKQVPAWDKRAFEESNPDARRNHPYEETMRMPREMGVREPMPPGRREPSPRGHGFKSRDARFSPKDNREAKFEPREPKFEPRDPKFVPRDPKFVPRDHKFEPRDPKFEPRDPKFEPRDPKFEPRDPRFEPRGPKFEPRDPKFEPRDPKFEPRDPKFEPRDPKFEPRDPKFDRRERGPQFEPHDPKFAARDPKFEPRDRKFGEPKFEPRDPKFEPRDPKYEPRAPKFEPRNDYKDRREFRRDDVAERKRDFTAREPFDEFERPQSREERRRGEHTREDFRKDDHKYPNEFDIEFEDIFKRTVEFKQRVEELRKPERGRESYEDNRRREPDCEERRKNPDKRERHEDRRGDRHPRDERPASHSDEALKQRDPEWKLQEKPGKRLTLRPSVKVKRDKAIEEISNKMMHKYGDDDMREDLKTRVHEELKLAISRIMQDMFGDQDVSFIELVVKFNSKHNTRDEVKIFKKVMSCLPTQYKNLKRPASDSTDVAAKHTRSSPEPKIKKDIAETSDHVALPGWNLPIGQQNNMQMGMQHIGMQAMDMQSMVMQAMGMQPMGMQQMENMQQVSMMMNQNPMMVPAPFDGSDMYNSSMQEQYRPEEPGVDDGYNLYLCKDDFKPFTDTQAEYLKQFLVCKVFQGTETSQGWAPNFTLKGLQSMFRYEVHTYDERSNDWLLKLDFSEFQLLSVLVYSKEEMWYERAAIWLPGHSRCRNIEPLDKLKLQNKHLDQVNIGKWKLVKKIINLKGTRIYVDMPPSAARALETHKMMLSYELQKVNVFLKAVAVDKDAFDSGLQEKSFTDLSEIMTATQSYPMPSLKEEPNIVKIYLKGSKSMSVVQARKIKEMIIYRLFKYLELAGASKTDFIKYGFCSPNFFGVLPENLESKRWLCSLALGRLNKQPVIIIGDTDTNLRFIKLMMTVPGYQCPPALVFERIKQSNQGVKKINFHLWKPITIVSDRHKAKFAVEVDLESAETIYKMLFQLDYMDDTQNMCVVKFKPEGSESSFLEQIQKYKAELTDSYDVANMDIDSQSENDDDIICLGEIEN